MFHFFQNAIMNTAQVKYVIYIILLCSHPYDIKQYSVTSLLKLLKFACD